MHPQHGYQLFARLKQNNPTPRTELKYNTPFELLVAVILSAQATDISVNKVTATLFTVANTPEDFLALGLAALENHIKSIGLYRAKAKYLLAASHIIVHQFQGSVPQEREALESLPGVGRKTANVILNVAFGQPTIAVDTHIFRVANRTGLAVGKNVLIVEKKLMEVVPEPFKQDAHHWLLLHGRYICKARNPHCAACPISDLCEYPLKRL